MKRQEVFVKCFETPKEKYFYDRYLNSVVQVNDKEYEELKKVEDGSKKVEDSEVLKKYLDIGLLQKSVAKHVENVTLEKLQYQAERCVEHLILQVTQNCNFRCDYCAYSGKYNNREHSDKSMSYMTAKKAIDFYMEKNRETKTISISFYGGEPLLEFELIKKCVTYIKGYVDDKTLYLGMTTNGTLIHSEEVIEFLVENNFHITISLDGPKSEHNANRRFINGAGTFDTVMRNLKKIKNYNADYFQKHVIYNCVMNQKTDVGNIMSFFSDTSFFPPGHVTLNSVSPSGLKDKALIHYGDKYYAPFKYEVLKLYLSMLGRIPNEETTLLYSLRGDTNRLCRDLHEHTMEREIMQHNGPCVPGIRRVFVTTEGELFPCERVSECKGELAIGTLDKGYNYEKMKFLMNFVQLAEDRCLNCWNLRQCSFCIGQLDSEEDVTKKDILDYCEKAKKEAEFKLRRLCILIELGFIPKEEEDEKNSYIPI